MLRRALLPLLALLLASPLAAPVGAADTVAVRQLRTQKVGPVTYFHVVLDAPPDMKMPAFRDVAPTEGPFRRWLGLLPRLAPQDDRTSAVYLRDLGLAGLPQSSGRLEFVGKVRGDQPARFQLVYPSRGALGLMPGEQRSLVQMGSARPFATGAVTLDWNKARRVKVPAKAKGEENNRLDRLWAAGQAQHFAILDVQARDFGFPAFACEATCRKYRVVCPPWSRAEKASDRFGLYELTTGATALTESLALGRFSSERVGERALRSLRVKNLRAIDIAEHPWLKMMAGKRPAAEPLARLVPHDNYYLTVTNLKAFNEAFDLLERWGGNVLRPVALHERDHHLRKRYETQLCLPSAELARAVPAKLVRAAALTGSDLFWQQGTDGTVLFHVTDADAFLKVQEPFLQRARKKWGGDLKETTTRFDKVEVKSFATPDRDVSLHRAVLDNVVVCSNSLPALRRVLDAARDRRWALSDALDYQYMRTVFVRDARSEDGFIFLSDAFIRRLVGPATRIKARRRAEALAALTLATHGALFVAHETGRWPSDNKELCAGSGIEPEQLEVPEGKVVVWDGKRGRAVSRAYGTLAFATPLIEQPIDGVTEYEANEYEMFRMRYMRLWRQFFDPVGIRFTLAPERARVETYILPLIRNNRYDWLRGLVGGGEARYDAAGLPKGTGAQGLFHFQGAWGLGDHFTVHLDADSSVYRQWIEGELRRDFGLEAKDRGLLWRLPITVGIGTKNVSARDRAMLNFLYVAFLTDGEVGYEHYRGYTIRRMPLSQRGLRQALGLVGGPGGFGNAESRSALLALMREEGAPKVIYDATIDGTWYITWHKGALERRIDALKSPARGKEEMTVNAALAVAPAAPKVREALELYLEAQTQNRALGSNVTWQALYQAGAVTPKMSGAEREAIAHRLFGYVPVSPDGSAHVFDARLGEVRNVRHGSFRRPIYRDKLAPNSGLVRLLESIQQVRIDFRFRQDGVHTILTLDRGKAR
jgi:hypothetical protein